MDDRTMFLIEAVHAAFSTIKTDQGALTRFDVESLITAALFAYDLAQARQAQAETEGEK